MNVEIQNVKYSETDYKITELLTGYVDDFLTKHYKEECRKESTRNALHIICSRCLLKHIISLIHERDFYDMLLSNSFLAQRIATEQLHCAANAYLLQKERLTEFL